LTSIPLKEFGNTYQYKEVAAGASDTIFRIDIPVGYVGFVDKIATTFYKDTYIELKIDDEIAETFKREIEVVDTNRNFLAEVANIDEPREYDPPFLVTYKVEFIAHNNDTTSHIFEVFCDGKCFDEVIGRKEAVGNFN